jgi:general secretion pathway protein L
LESFQASNLPLAENRGLPLEKLFVWKQPAALKPIIESLRPELELVEISSLPESFRLDWPRFPYSIDLISPEVLRRRRFWFRFEMAAVVFLLLSLLGLPVAVVAGKTRHLQKLEGRLTEVRQQVEKLKGIRKRNRELLERFAVFGRLIQEHTRTVDILKELTEVLPQDTWLRTLSIKERRIYLQGSSSSATTAVKALEDSPLFKEVHFDSPVVKRGGKETFKIVVDLE